MLSKQSEKGNPVSQKMVHFSAHPIFEGLKKKANERKCLSALILSSEAEGTRTHNLRIDSPNVRFVSPYGETINNCQKKTYETNRRTTED